MQNYTNIPSSQRVSDSLALLLNNDLTGISRNSGTAFPTIGLQVGMPFVHLTERKLYRLESLSPVTWTLELDLAKTLVYSETIDTVNALVATKVSLSGGVMTGLLTLSGNPTQTLHAATKGYVDTVGATASASANTRVLKTGDTMTGQLTLPGDPTLDLHAATKRYADYLFNTVNQNKVNKAGDTVNEIYNTGWYRSTGNVGWYNQTYGGGLYMVDSVYLRGTGAQGLIVGPHQLLNNGQIYTGRYGYLENYFASKSAEDRITAASTTESGSGSFYNPGGYYLTRSGAYVYLVKPRQNCNCDCNCNCSCFPAGTMVLMADGTQKLIETIQVGDQVMGWDGQPDEVDLMEYPILGERRLAGFADGSLSWSEEHLAWTRRDGHEWFGTLGKNWWYAEVLADHVVGLRDNATLRDLDEDRDEFAHVSGWVKRKLVAEKADYNTQLYLPRTKRTHMIIVNGYLMTAGTDGFAVDYTQVNWKGLPHVAA
ncbi:Hom_end-associated Hint family protein [Achromobacter phage JWF]|uniref:Hom_end-associated Hint family protein n=1 Tax=Achromobacter phage JWF TaxID=1589748 RepID=UPI000588E147|nr:Hom_end-associated Hint family protein [Achromobacter phage JWF]AJD82922.1 Hom_end-associated Hint family protein [Achromobacter phage JWF]